jgi:hypothetical protein
MAGWMIRLGGTHLVPLINLLNEHLLEVPVIHCSETHLQLKGAIASANLYSGAAKRTARRAAMNRAPARRPLTRCGRRRSGRIRTCHPNSKRN